MAYRCRGYKLRSAATASGSPWRREHRSRWPLPFPAHPSLLGRSYLPKHTCSSAHASTHERTHADARTRADARKTLSARTARCIPPSVSLHLSALNALGGSGTGASGDAGCKPLIRSRANGVWLVHYHQHITAANEMLSIESSCRCIGPLSGLIRYCVGPPSIAAIALSF